MRVFFVMMMLVMGGMLSHITAQTDFFSDDVDHATLAEEAPHTATFRELALNRPLGFLVYDLTDDVLLGGINILQQLPVVSAIKGPVLMYFLYFVPQDIWGSLPVAYWNTKRDAIPEEYLPAWDAHYPILNGLYRMIVYSDNFTTGDALLYAYQYTPYVTDYHPIQAFNRWSYAEVGISPDSGLREWNKGGTNHPLYIERDFDLRTTLIYGVPRFYNNTFSVLDLARYYYWLYHYAPEELFEVAKEVMSIVEGYPGFLELTAFNLDGTPVSKDGFVGPGDENNAREEWLTADAGLMLFDDRDLLVVSMSVNGGDRTDELYGEIERIVRAERQQLFWTTGLDYVAWMRSNTSPYGESRLSTEALYFIADFMYEQGVTMTVGRDYTEYRELFLFARDFWLTVFPDDIVPPDRNATQSRVMQIRYAGTGGTLTQLAYELGLIAP